MADAARINAMDTAGAWVLHELLMRLREGDVTVTLRGLAPRFAKLLDVVGQPLADGAGRPVPPGRRQLPALERLGHGTEALWTQSVALLAFVGECSYTLARCSRHPSRCDGARRCTTSAVPASTQLPIVALLSFMIGIVIAYQSADQLRQYGANIFVADLVGLSMLREFAPLITAIIIAGRSGSAYAAQIGTMQVTEEIDAMRTLGIPPQEQLVVPSHRVGHCIAAADRVRGLSRCLRRHAHGPRAARRGTSRIS